MNGFGFNCILRSFSYCTLHFQRLRRLVRYSSTIGRMIQCAKWNSGVIPRHRQS